MKHFTACLSWGYLDSVMEQMEFGGKWRSWIRGFLSSARASVIVNGSTTKEFALERGIQQGEPLSPFRFILVVEVLNIVTEEVAEQKISKGITLPNMGPEHILLCWFPTFHVSGNASGGCHVKNITLELPYK
uniref:Reverse transcriptase domain-containing protein n=1 Tax=Lactuca sativa TaxID=4236 RepID=A0A9R1XN01_LACSA|nr:hypothetical protein LSAT_V11C200080440 [Lactuca sativa]